MILLLPLLPQPRCFFISLRARSSRRGCVAKDDNNQCIKDGSLQWRRREQGAPPPLQEEEISKLLSTIDRLNSSKQDDASAFPVLRIGDSVERGPDWKWGTQDQCDGCCRCHRAAAVARHILRVG